MSLKRTIASLCLHYLLFVRVLQTDAEKNFKTKVKYDIAKYFFDSNYHCFNVMVFPDGQQRPHIRRCKLQYGSPNLFSPRCIFCPIPCSYCAMPLTHYTYGSTFSSYFKKDKMDYNCHFHSVHAIEPRKIRSKKGATVQGDVKCQVKNHCKGSPCKNKGTCVNLFYSHACICTKDFYGKDCSSKAGSNAGKLSHGIQLWFPLEVNAARVFPFLVTVANEGIDQTIELSTGTGYTVVIKPGDKIKDFASQCGKTNYKCRCDSKACKTAYKGMLIADNYYLKENFDNLPMMFSDIRALGFVTHITIKVFNDKFSKTSPVFQDTIPSYTKLRYQTIFYSLIHPNCDCQTMAKGKTKINGDCRASFTDRPKLKNNKPASFYFTPEYVEYGWQVFKREADKNLMDETGEVTSSKLPQACQKVFSFQYQWRIYSVNGLHKLTARTEDSMQINVCEKKQKNSNLMQKCDAKLSKVKAGDYMVRLTLTTFQLTNETPKRYSDNEQMNYYCYFKLMNEKREFKITGDAIIKQCIVSIDTAGYDMEGTLIWTCTVKKGGPCPPQLSTNSDSSIHKVPFKDGEYDICIDWKSEGDTVAKPCVKVEAKDCDQKKPLEPDFIIHCKDNCETNPDPTKPARIGVLDRNEVQTPKDVTYKIVDSKGNEVDLNDVVIKDKGAGPNEIKIDLQKLTPGEPYTITAKIGDHETPPFELKYDIIDEAKDGNCTVYPLSGMKGFTLFDIECFGWQAEGPILYEFFDKGPDDSDHYQGRMISYSYSGILSKFRLTRGKVVIYLLNEDGDGPTVDVTVELTDFNNNISHIDYLMNELDSYMDYDNYQPSMDIMSTAAEILSKDMNNEYYLRKIISTMAKVKHNSAESMKLGLSTILSVLVNGTLKGTYLLDDILEKYTGKILLDLAQVYLKYATKPGHTPRLRAKDINQLSRNLMDCVDMSMIAQDKNVTKLGPEEDINYDVLDNLNEASNDIAEALMIGMYLVGRFQVYSEPGSEITSTERVTDMWAYVNNAAGLVDVAGSNLSSYVNMSQDLASTFDPNHDIMLQFALMNKNLFWWAQNNINTEVLMVGLAEKLYKPGYYYVPNVKSPVQIFMKVKKMKKSTIEGNTTQLDPDLDTDVLDRTVVVHRFILPPLSRLFITFNFNGSDSASSLRVLVNFNERPNWESLSEAKPISSENPDVVMPYDIVEREHFYYMGVLPDESVPVNESVTYSFDVYFVNCHIWENQWVNHYCLVGTRTSLDTIECRCTHMSIFSSTIFIPPNDINPVLDAPLFLTVMDNPYVVIFVIIILLLFLLLLLWAFRKDRKDALCSDVIVLHDNFPGESYAYLIAIFTGSRLTAGTSAVVGLRLYGDIYASRPTILKCENRKVLQRDNDDWFLLCYPVSLGMLNAVQMWHNNKGRGPDWFCSKVLVFDLHAKTQYLFIVDQWLAMEADEYPEAMVRPATSDEVLSIKRIFLDNSVLGLRENHLHLSVLARHPRSPVSRKQRLVVLMVLVMSAMLASIMFFKVSDNFAADVDEYHYTFGQRELIISIQSFIVSTVFAFIAMFLFRKGYKQKEVHRHHSTLFMPRKRSSISDQFWLSEKPAYVDLSTFIAYDEKPQKQRKDMTMYETFITAIKNCTHQKTLRPVHLASEESEIKVKKGWLITAWVFSIFVIIMCAYLVMLYSLKFGKIKSLMWLSSLVVSQLQDIFLFTPLKIIVIAILLSAAFERTTDISAFKLDINKAVKGDLIGNKKYLNKLVELRKSSDYYPMTDEVKAKKRRRTMRKMKWRMICDFFAVLTYILILCYIMRLLWSGAHYYPNAHASDMLMTKYHGRFVALQDVYNRTQFFSYLQNTFVRSMFVFRWFSDLSFSTLSHKDLPERKDWAKDFVSKMVGAPRLRQLRVVAGVCTINQMMLVAIKECNHPWSVGDMDTDTYGVQWKKAGLEDELAYAWGYRTYWMYNNPKNTSVFPISGKSGTVYPTGGYILPLAVKRESTKSYAIQVEEEHWIDERTRAIFLELTLYNVNNYLFSQVTAVIEQMTSGLFMASANVDSVHTTEDWSIWNGIYIVFMVALVIKIAYNVNRHGLFNFFTRFLNIYELLVIVIGVLSIVYYLIHVKVSTFYVEQFNREGQDLFFNFKDMIKYFLYTKVLLWVLFCLLVFRLFVSWYFGPTYIYFYNTFVISKRWIIKMMLLLLIYFYIIWRFIGYTVDALIFYNYRVIILHYKMYTNIFTVEHLTRTKIVALMLCFLALFFKIIFFTLFTHYYKIGKRKKLKPMQYFNIFSFYGDEINRGLGKKKDEPLPSDRQIHRKRDMKVPKK